MSFKSCWFSSVAISSYLAAMPLPWEKGGGAEGRVTNVKVPGRTRKDPRYKFEVVETNYQISSRLTAFQIYFVHKYKNVFAYFSIFILKQIQMIKFLFFLIKLIILLSKICRYIGI